MISSIPMFKQIIIDKKKKKKKKKKKMYNRKSTKEHWKYSHDYKLSEINQISPWNIP